METTNASPSNATGALTLANIKSVSQQWEIEMKLREKKWDECTIDEKTEKLRLEYRNFDYLNNSLGRALERLESLERHTHSDRTGEITIPYNIRHSLNAAGAMIGRKNNLE